MTYLLTLYSWNSDILFCGIASFAMVIQSVDTLVQVGIRCLAVYCDRIATASPLGE